MKYLFLIALIISQLLPMSGQCSTQNKHALVPKYLKPAHVEQEIWDSVSPYFLPENHPAKPQLDAIFHSGVRVIQSSKTLKNAGFKNAEPGKYSGTVVTTHKKLNGYILKLYTDDQLDKIDWAYLKDRVTGALSVQRTIDTHRYASLVKTPKKWLYPLPATPAAPEGMLQKNFILIEEDMKTLRTKRSLAIWRTNVVTKTLLDAVFVILKENGLIDCAYAFNMPFAEDGRVAFIDTEQHHHSSVPYVRLLPYLSPNNQMYWRQLIQNGGP